MSLTNKPKCNLDIYTLYLLAEPKYFGCNRLAEIFDDFSHDCVNRFLLGENYHPQDLFAEIKLLINWIGGIISVDDTVGEKVYSNPNTEVYLKSIGKAKVFKTHLTDEIVRFYIIILPQESDLSSVVRDDFKGWHHCHWGIESYHRALKQLCGISKFFVRKSQGILNHFFCSIYRQSSLVFSSV